MALTLEQLMNQLGGLLGSNQATAYAAPDSVYSPVTGMGGTNQASVLPQFGSTADGLGTGLGFNIGTGQLALSGLGSLASLYGGLQSLGLAKDQFKFTKAVTNTNLNNQIKSYNTALEDRARARGVAEGQSAADVQSYIDKNRLNR